MYDSVWNRWVILAQSIPESTTRQLLFVASSTTSNPLGSYFICTLNVVFNPGDCWVYAQLGMDQDAILITAYVVLGSGPNKGSDLLAIAKARLYNGLGFSVPVFTGLRGPLAPPIVLDQNAKSFLVSATLFGGNTLGLYTLTNGPSYFLGPGIAAYTSPTWYDQASWTYYSAVSIDPRNPRHAWLVNEDVQSNHEAGSRIVGIGFAG